MPLSEQDIIAARVRAAEAGVPWNRERVILEAIAKVAARRALKKRRRLQAAFAACLLVLLALAWLLLIRR